MNTVAEASLKTVPVEERHEKLEILLLAVVRRGRHQQQVATCFAKLLTDLVALSVFDVAAEIGRRHALRFIADDEIPLAGARQLFLQLLVPSQDIKANDQPVSVLERIT